MVGMSELTTNSDTSLVKRLEEAPESGLEVILFKVSTKKFNEVRGAVLSYLTNFSEGVFVSFNKPCPSLKKTLRSSGVNVDNIVFVDCMTRLLGGTEEENCIYTNSPDPVYIQVALKRAMDRICSEFKFVYMESLSTLTLYNSEESLIKFVRQVTGKIRVSGFVGLLFTLENEMSDELYSQLYLMSDYAIEIT